jgi:hypothetical protein
MKRLMLLALPLGLAACMTDHGGPSAGQGRVNLTVSGQRSMLSTTTASVVQAGDSTILAADSDTVIVRSVNLVVRRIELKPVETAACESDSAAVMQEGEHHDSAGDNGDAERDSEGCEEIKAGPVLVSLPLGTTAVTALVDVSAPAGQYNKLEFKVHAPRLPRDSAFIAANPGFDSVSIQVTGTFSHAGTRNDFTYTSRLEAEEEAVIDPPLVVDSTATASVTLRFDISTWFAGPGGVGLVDPGTGNEGGANEQLIRNNIKSSINAFEDEDHDGHDDHDGGHGGGHGGEGDG